MITSSTQVVLVSNWGLELWRGTLIDYFIEYGISKPRPVLAIVDALQAGKTHAHLGGLLATLSLAHLKETT